MILALWLVAVSAQAKTLAVLPFDQGAGSAEHEGLGLAVAGMVVSDLQKTAGVELVERSRVDALLAEIDLGKTAFIDPKTAQKTGKGLGVELVVVGSWSVVGATFLLDARVVEVGSARVVGAADAQGTLDDFVTVEKELIEELTGAMGLSWSGAQRRQILGEAPTESKEAFLAWSQALEARRAGENDRAQKALEQAVTADPQFDEALSALSELRSLVDQSAKSAQKAQVDERTRVRLAALETTTPPSKIKDPDDLAARADFAFRIEILEQLGRHCQRADEMLEWGRKIDWKVSRDFDREAGVAFWEQTCARAVDAGLTKAGPWGKGVHDSTWGDMTFPFRGVTSYLLGYQLNNPAETAGHSWARSAGICHPRAEEAVLVKKIISEVRQRRALSDPPDPTYPKRTVEDQIVAYEAMLELWVHGPKPAPAEALALLVRKYPDDPEGFWARNVASLGASLARGWEARMVQAGGLSAEAMVSVVEALAGESKGRLAASPMCTAAAAMYRGSAEAALVGLRAPHQRDPEQSYDELVRFMGPTVGALADFGCVEGVGGRPPSAQAMVDRLRTLRERRRPDAPQGCDESLRTLVVLDPKVYEGLEPDRMALTLLSLEVTRRNIVALGCSSDPVLTPWAAPR